MANRAMIAISDELHKKLNELKGSSSFDHYIKGLVGMPVPEAAKRSNSHKQAEVEAMEALQPGGRCVLSWERDASDPSAPALNSRHLAQMVRRCQERTGFRLYTEGSARGLVVIRAA